MFKNFKFNNNFLKSVFFIWVLTLVSYNIFNKVENVCSVVGNSANVFKLYGADDKLLSNKIQFLANGSIDGYRHQNEYAWSCNSGVLSFYNEASLQTSKSDKVTNTFDGGLKVFGTTGLKILYAGSAFHSIINILFISFIFLTTFLFVFHQKSKKIIFFGILIFIISPIIFRIEFLSSDIIDATTPSAIRLILFGLISGITIKLSRGSLKIIKLDILLIIYFFISITFFYISRDGFFINPIFGKHWFYLANQFLSGSLSLGSGFFLDAATVNGKWYMPYGHGPIIFAMVFGGLIKFGAIVLVISSVYIYLRIYRIINKSDDGILNIALVLLTIYFCVILLAGFYYPYPNIGASYFLGIGLLFYYESKKEFNINYLLACSFFILIGSLFRVEIVATYLVLIFSIKIPLYENKSIDSYSKLKLLSYVTFFLLAIILNLLQNYLKFGDAYQSGIGYNHMINNPLFKPLSLEYFSNNLFGYFYRLPVINFNKSFFLDFPFNGSEPGGYFFVRYLGLFIGIYILINWLSFNLSYKAIGHINNLEKFPGVIIFTGFSLLIFYLFAFNTSPRYDTLFAPLLVVSGIYYFPSSLFLNFFAFAFFFWVNISIYWAMATKVFMPPLI